ncbi:Hypp2458 [Branchiostoma lanceolatum]|uniref:Hypp2458 protein n=1 Tax=Branchiostoma lanceolatum TaxID=7740 RepID=A0A8J9ZTQ2_BRALA|nr:Hypp2458 [Branchiostoma lanceolatum]
MLKHHCVRSVTSPVPSRVDPANGPSSATDTPISLLVRPSSATVTTLIRANPSPEVTDPATRLPLPTLVYRLEAVHLGDLLRLSVRTDAKIARLSLQFSRAHLSAPDTAKAAVLYGAAVPISGRTDSRTRAPYKEKSTLSGAHTHVNDFACVAAPGEHFPVRGNVNPIPFRYAGAARDAQNPAATPATVRPTNLGRTRGPNLVTAGSKQSGPGRRAVTTKPGPHFRTSTRGGSTRTRARGFGARRGGPPARRGLAQSEWTAATAGRPDLAADPGRPAWRTRRPHDGGPAPARHHPPPPPPPPPRGGNGQTRRSIACPRSDSGRRTHRDHNSGDPRAPGTFRGDVAAVEPVAALRPEEVQRVRTPRRRPIGLTIHDRPSGRDGRRLNPPGGPCGSTRLPLSGFTNSLTLSSKFFSTFPHGTCSLSVSCPYLALGGVYLPLWAAFPNNPTPRRGRPNATVAAMGRG